MVTTQDMTTELYYIYDSLNDRYFDGELPTPFITIKAGKTKTKAVYGTFSPDSWAKGDADNIIEEGIHEIAMSGEYLSRPIPNMAATLCHEMVHLYCQVNEIDDTSNNGVYHNTKFKNEAEKRGLIIERADVIGWSVTTPTAGFIDFINSLKIDEEIFSYFRNTHIGVTNQTVKKRWVCPVCGQQVQAKKTAMIGCWDCGMQMDYWDLTIEGEEEMLIDNNSGAAYESDWYKELGY